MHFIFFLVLFVAASLITWVMARHVRVMDIPNERSSHTKPIPRSGGVAIVSTFTVGSVWIVPLYDVVQNPGLNFWGLLGCALFLAGVSYWDDVTQKSFFAKLFTQIVCTAFILLLGWSIKSLHVPIIGALGDGVLTYTLTAIWILGLTNAVNFMDGLDGLVGGVSLVATVFLGWIALLEGNHLIYLLSHVLVSGVSGFLIFNWFPARIFMGDVGSAFLGFVFSLIAVVGTQIDSGYLSFYVIPLLLFNLIFDSAFTFFRRLLSGENVLVPHRSHVYQLLNRLGWSHAKVSLLYMTATVFQGVAAWWLTALPPEYQLGVFIPFLTVYGVFSISVIYLATVKGVLKS